MKRLTTFIAGAAVAATLGGCQQPAVSGWKSFSGDKNIERRVDSVLSLMTLEEKVGQMAQYSCNWDVTGPVMTGDYETLLKQGLVGSLFNVYTVDGVRKMQEMALSESRLKIPVLFGYDVVHGYRTIFPMPLAESCSWDLERMRKSAAIAGALGSAAPLVWLGRAAADGSLADLGLTLLWTVLPFALAYVLLNRSFIRIVTTRRGQIKVQYEKKAMRTSSQNAALYRRELARLTSSSGYMLNAGLGLVFELVLAVLAIVKRQELLAALTAIPDLREAAAPILLLACMMVSGMVFFTASSVSLEGKYYWIVRSMPVKSEKILQAKLNLSNSLSAGPALLMMLAAALALQLPAAETVLLLACQLLFVLLTANVGLVEDLRHCNLDWINETQAAKQGAGVLLSMLLNFGFVVAVGALYFFLLAELMPTAAFLGLMLALLAILYALTARWIKARGAKRFESLR